jgi:hypothetical protein
MCDFIARLVSRFDYDALWSRVSRRFDKLRQLVADGHAKAVGRGACPGYAYLVAGGGIDDQDALRPVRSYRIDHQREDITRSYLDAVRANCRLACELDPVTAAAFGDASRTECGE